MKRPSRKRNKHGRSGVTQNSPTASGSLDSASLAKMVVEMVSKPPKTTIPVSPAFYDAMKSLASDYSAKSPMLDFLAKTNPEMEPPGLDIDRNHPDAFRTDVPPPLKENPPF